MRGIIEDRFTRGVIRRLLDGASNVAHSLAGSVMGLARGARDAVLPVFVDNLGVDGAVEFRRVAYAKLPHPKRAERLHMVKGIMLHETEDYISKGVSKQKRELRKTDATGRTKAGRLFVGMSKGALAAPELPAIAKTLLDGETYVTIAGIDVTVYCPLHPDLESKRHSAKLHIACHHSRDTAVITCYSDDVILTLNRGGHCKTFNVDGSKFDQSHLQWAFGLVGVALAQLDPSGSYALVQQCMQPVTVRNPGNDEQFFEVLPNGKRQPFLASGSSLTTLINTLTSISLGLIYITHLVNPLIDLTEERVWRTTMERAAATLGYVITIESCEIDGVFDPIRMELLRTRYDPDTDQVFTDPIAYLRSLCRRDATDAASFGWSPLQWKNSTPSMRMHRAVAQVVNGLKAEPPNAILSALRERFLDPAAPAVSRDGQLVDVSDLEYSLVDGCTQERDVTMAVRKLHNLTDQDVESLVTRIQGVQVGMRLEDNAMAKMLHNTYGVASGVPAMTVAHLPLPHNYMP